MAIQKFEVWQPRWRDRSVLLADFKIGAHNVITFPKTPSYAGEWYISGENAKHFPIEPMKTKSGTTMIMRCVPLGELERYEA